eukprot:6183094-Pleurochrysis_carterae.AAC.3
MYCKTVLLSMHKIVGAARIAREPASVIKLNKLLPSSMRDRVAVAAALGLAAVGVAVFAWRRRQALKQFVWASQHGAEKATVAGGHEDSIMLEGDRCNVAWTILIFLAIIAVRNSLPCSTYAHRCKRCSFMDDSSASGA